MPVVVGIDVGTIEPSLAPLQEFECDGSHVTSEGSLVRPTGKKSFLKYRYSFLDFKGTVQRKLTWVKRGINRQLMTCHCSGGYFFLNLKGLRSLKSINVF
jgi:hypothetical protein